MCVENTKYFFMVNPNYCISLQNYFNFFFLEVDMFCFLTLLYPASVAIRALTYSGLVANECDGNNFDDKKLSKYYVTYS